MFLPWHLAAAFGLDLLLGDPRRWPHPIRWIGRLILWVERIFYDASGSPLLQRLAGVVFWVLVIVAVMSATLVLLGLFSHLNPILGQVAAIWLAYTTLATRSLHRESRQVVQALQDGDIVMARKHLAGIVSRDTGQLGEKDIVRAVIETVSENISDGIIAPLLYLAVAGPLGGMTYKTINTMDSMVGYMNQRYRYFGWFAARADDAVNWFPARVSGYLLVAAAACLKLDWWKGWVTMRRDARKMKSPNSGFPEAAAAGALHLQLGGANRYFGETVMKPTLGEPLQEMTLDVYSSMIRLMYVASFLAFALALGVRYLVALV